MINSAQNEWERSAAVGKADPKIRVLLKDSPQDHGSYGKSGFAGHSHQPLQPVAAHPVRAKHVPRVHQDGKVKLNTRLPEDIKFRVIEFSPARLSPNLNTDQTNFRNAVQLLDGQPRVLQGHGPERDKVVGMTILHFNKVIVEVPMKNQSFFGRGKI